MKTQPKTGAHTLQNERGEVVAVVGHAAVYELPVQRPVYRLNLQKPHTIYRTRDGVRVPSVTTVLGLIDKPQLVRWANRMGLEGIDTEKFVDRAADVGTITHARIQAFVEGADFDPGEYVGFMPATEAAFQRFVTWWGQEGYTHVESERVLVSEILRTGGTADHIARRRDGELDLLDIKTGRRIYGQAGVQVSIYRAIYNEVMEEQEMRIDRAYVIRVGHEQDDELQIREVLHHQEHVEFFIHIREAYPRWQRISNRY